MATVIGVRFKKAGKVYYFDPTDIWPQPGSDVVVETMRGPELGEVVTGAREVSDEQIVTPLKKVLRLATEEDEKRYEYNRKAEAEAYSVCMERIAHHRLDMKLVSVEYTFDGSKIIFYFTADGRVDFRDLVKDLAGIFKMRIELRQIGVRDEAKMLGGLGSCGRPICCDTFLGDFQPVSIKMAKEQNLSLNPTKISGQCGRLMCCLKYEQDDYEATIKKLPKIGKDIVTPDGIGVLTEINVIKDKVKVRIRSNDDDTFDVREYNADDVKKLTPAERQELNELNAQRYQQQQQQLHEQNRAKEAAAAEAANAEEPEKPQRKRYPRPKHEKVLNTEQYMEKYAGSDSDNTEDPVIEE